MSQKTELKKLVIKAAVRRVALDMLDVDPSYQREVKVGHKKIVADFNPQALGIPLVAERKDSTLWIVDGLQRITALRTLGRDTVKVEVFASSGPEHEAKVFKLVNFNRVKLQPLEEYRALLAAHDPAAWELKELVEKCGFRIANDGRHYAVLRCVNTLRYMLRCHKAEGLTFALTTTKEAWPDDMLGTFNDLLAGLSLFYSKKKGLVDKERLLPRLRTTTPQKILYKAKLMTHTDRVSGDVAEIIERLYAKRIPRSKGF